MKTVCALGILTAVLLPSFAAADDTIVPVRVATLVQDLKGNDGKLVEVEGFYLADPMEVPHLYASRQDALDDKEFDSLDLLFADESLKADISSPNPVCVIIKGIFSTYDHGRVLVGLTSKYGVLQVQSTEPCNA